MMRLNLFLMILSICCTETILYAVDPPFYSGECSSDCTSAPNLPCSAHYKAVPCPLDTIYPEHLWPAAPDRFVVGYEYEAKGRKCLAKLKFRWTAPNDRSGLGVKGFQLQLISLSGDTVNMQMCVTVDLSAANWTEQDIANQVPFNSSCILVPPGEYYADIYSLPKPPPGAVDKHAALNQNIIVDNARLYKGKCVIPDKKTTHHVTRRPTEARSVPITRTTQIQPKLTEAQGEVHETAQQSPWVMGTSLGIGIAIGLILIVLSIIIIVKRPCQNDNRNNEGQSDGEILINDDTDDDPDIYRPQTPPPDHTPTTDSGIYPGEGTPSPLNSHSTGQNGNSILPINPHDVGSILGSEIFADFNNYPNQGRHSRGHDRPHSCYHDCDQRFRPCLQDIHL